MIASQPGGVESMIILCIGSPKNIVETTDEGKTSIIKIKNEDYRATTQEIREFLKRAGIEIPTSTLYYKLLKLRENGLIKYGPKRNIHELTHKGKKLLDQIQLIERGKGLLHMMAKEPAWAFLECSFENGEPRYLDVHMRLFETNMIKKILRAIRKHSNKAAELDKVARKTGKWSLSIKGNIASTYLGYAIVMSLLFWSEGFYDLISFMKKEGMDEHDIEWLLTKVIELEKDKEYKEFFEKIQEILRSVERR